jgi:hypothetical protein
MADSSSLYSPATSQRPLLGDDDDSASLRTERPASVYTAADTVVGFGAEVDDAAELKAFDPPLGIFTHRRYIRDEITVLEYAEAKSSISGCVFWRSARQPRRRLPPSPALTASRSQLCRWPRGRKDTVVHDVGRNQPVFIRHAPAIVKALMSNKMYRDASTEELVLSLKMTWEATLGRTVMSGKDEAGEELLRCKSKTMMTKAKLETTFVNRLSGSGEEVVLKIAGDFRGKKDARIELGDTGRAVAIIRRASKWTAGEWLLINGQVGLAQECFAV